MSPLSVSGSSGGAIFLDSSLDRERILWSKHLYSMAHDLVEFGTLKSLVNAAIGSRTMKIISACQDEAT